MLTPSQSCTYTAFNITGNTPGPVTKPGYDPVYPDPRPHEWNKSVQCGIFKPTNVISISYLDWEDETSAPYLERQCLEYLKLALQGVTFLASSGKCFANVSAISNDTSFRL